MRNWEQQIHEPFLIFLTDYALNKDVFGKSTIKNKNPLYVFFLCVERGPSMSLETKHMMTTLSKNHDSLLWPRPGLNWRHSVCKTDVITIYTTRPCRYMDHLYLAITNYASVESKLSCG